jgi:hypothetical protein
MLNELSMFNDYFQFFMCFLRKRINISVTLVSESYVILYYENKFIDNEEIIIQSQEIKYIIQTSKQMTIIQYICPTGSQSYL